MRSKDKLSELLLFFVMVVVLLLLLSSEPYLNAVVKRQILYLLVIAGCGYVLRDVFGDILHSRSKLFSVSFYNSILDFSHLYEDFIYTTKKIALLRLKEGLPILFSILYVIFSLFLIKENGGFEKSSARLIIMSFLPVIGFLFYLGGYYPKMFQYRFFIYVSFFLLLLLFISLEGSLFILDFLLFLLGIWILLVGMIYPREKLYSLALFFILLIPFSLFIGKEKSSNFFANCAYMLLLVGVLKDLFYDLVFKK